MIHKRFDVELFGDGDLSKCLTKLKVKGTKIITLSVNDGVAHFQTNPKGLKLIRKYRRRYGLKVNINSTSKDLGLKALFNNYRYVIVLFIPFACSFFLWSLTIESDMPEVEERIEEKLVASKITLLRPLFLLPGEDEIRRDLMQNDPSLSWVRFKRNGTSFTVIPMLSPPSKSTLKEPGPPADLVASTGGVLTRFALTKGERVGIVNSTVKKGDLLATGVLEQGDKKIVVGAEGAVFADYWIEYEFSMPKKIIYKVQGEENVAFTFNPPWNRDNFDENSFWHIVTTERLIKEELRQVNLVEGMEETVIVPLLKKKLLEERGASAVVKNNKVLHVAFDNDKVKGTILFLVNDDIAVKRRISQGD